MTDFNKDTDRTKELSTNYESIIRQLGENPDREGLKKTPERVAEAMQFLTKGYDEDPDGIIQQAIFHEEYSEMVIVKDIELYSLCEHHMLPFSVKRMWPIFLTARSLV